MNNSNVLNPIFGLSANQIVRLFEQGAALELSQNHQLLAIACIEKHLSFVPEATLESVLNSLFQITELRCFASTSYRCFLCEELPVKNSSVKSA